MSRGDGRGIAESALLLAIGFLLGFLTIGRPLSTFDEGLVLVGAERVLNGELPYRDFYALYPPGQYYIVAALFALFGTKVMTLRLYCLVVRALVAWLVFLVTRRIAGRGAALVAWSGAAVWAATFGNFGLTTYPALALVLLALWLLLGELERGGTEAAARPASIALAGTALATAALIRHDLGAYGLVASLPLVAGLARRFSLRAVAMPFAAALVAAFLLLALPFLILAPWREIAFELLLYPAQSYAAMRALPYPPVVVPPPSLAALATPVGFARATPGLPFLLPPIAAGLALGALALGAVAPRRSRRGGETDREPRGGARNAGLCALALLALCAVNLARVRPDLLHAVPSVIVAFGVAAALARRLMPSGWAGRTIAMIVLALAAGVAVPAVAALAGSRPAQLFAAGGDADPGRAAHLPAEPLLRELAELVRHEVPGGEPIFVGCGRHDRVFINEPMLYFLAGRLPGTRYHALDPGVATTRAAQEEIIRGLERNRVRVVVLSTRNDNHNEPNGSSISGGVTTLDDYLASHYAPAVRVEPWYTLLRRTAPWELDVSARSTRPKTPSS